MKVRIEIDCTPSEARRFLGFPDLEPMQEALLKRLEQQTLEQIEKLSPESLVRSWFSAGVVGTEHLQSLLAGALKGAGETGTA